MLIILLAAAVSAAWFGLLGITWRYIPPNGDDDRVPYPGL
jgi:hypothetical protein